MSILYNKNKFLFKTWRHFFVTVLRMFDQIIQSAVDIISLYYIPINEKRQCTWRIFCSHIGTHLKFRHIASFLVLNIV